jgi:hypothetical protein
LTEKSGQQIFLVRYFAKVDEDTFNGKATLGYSGKMKTVDFNSQQYSFFQKQITL